LQQAAISNQNAYRLMSRYYRESIGSEFEKNTRVGMFFLLQTETATNAQGFNPE
jgi:hypothetical protein